MSVEDPDDLDRVDREIRANERNARRDNAEELPWSDDDDFLIGASSDFVKGSHFTMLIDAGVELPAPETMEDDGLTAKLWEVIHELAERQVYLINTDHLSDRDLYAHLWSETLHEWIPLLPFDDMVCTIDLVGSGSEEHINLYHRFYADEQHRRDWAEHFPDDEMPPREKPPYNRDRLLPKHRWDTSSGGSSDDER